MKQRVKSGDSENIEAVAAAKYFKLLFGNSFSRAQENGINAALNYGYAILRSTIEKYLIAYGYEPAIGLFHKNALDSFNLADDFIEPFRPLVDLFVKRYTHEEGSAGESSELRYHH
ncbi:MAG: type II CRISPR-associated endonuclease Cas1 [Ruminococcus sp.]|nr:type II CRISPR-associated endonuclease Cas1 [Ruminococcus sp.]